MRIENIGPDDIQVGDVITGPGDDAVVSHVLEPGWVVGDWNTHRSVLGWVDDAWRLDGDATFNARSAYRDVPDKWVRLDVDRVGPKGRRWAFMVELSIDMLDDGTREAWAQDVAGQTAQWLTDRLNEGHFGEMPTADGEAV